MKAQLAKPSGHSGILELDISGGMAEEDLRRRSTVLEKAGTKPPLTKASTLRLQSSSIRVTVAADQE